MENKKIKFEEIIEKLKGINFGEIDLVVAIARGGIVPGSLIANILKKDLKVIWLNFRDDSHKPQHDFPILTKDIDFDTKNKKILIVDDVSRSGATINKAKSILGKNTKTFVINGKADFSLYNNDECLLMPWN